MTYLQTFAGNFWTVVIVLVLIVGALALIAFMGFVVVIGLNNWLEARAQKRHSKDFQWLYEQDRKKPKFR